MRRGLGNRVRASSAREFTLFMEKLFEDRFWESEDGLKLHYRHYHGPEDRPPLLCMHGLTRNARDFEGLAERYAGEWRLIVPEMRGRGGSDHAKDSASYSVPTYLKDVDRLLEQEDVSRFVAIGTSMGGLMTMMMAKRTPERIVAALLNDIGPVLEADGLGHIGSYLGHLRSYPTWMHAARSLQEVQKRNHPTFGVEDWLRMAKRLMVLGQNGRITYDYDLAIAEPFDAANAGEQPDLWPAFEALAGRPLILTRGEHSGLLSVATATDMQSRVPEMDMVTVSNTGHAPTLDEPEVHAALDRMLAKIA